LKDVVAIGIGGSFLGPLFVHTALQTGCLINASLFNNISTIIGLLFVITYHNKCVCVNSVMSTTSKLVEDIFIYLYIILQTLKLLNLQGVVSCAC